MSDIPINLVVEDELSEAVCYKILSESHKPFYIGTTYGKHGYGYIKEKIYGFNQASKGTPYFILVDLEDECAPLQIENWLVVPKNNNLIFRIAVKEIESWLLADRKGFSSFLNLLQKIVYFLFTILYRNKKKDFTINQNYF